MAKREIVKKECYCGNVNDKFIDREIRVYGWVNKIRELGGLTFIDLRDRQGLLQIVINESFKDPQILKNISRETVLSVTGTVVRRSNPNPDLPTGQIELIASGITVLAESELPPFFPENNSEVSEELRFKYRYLDLRNSRLQENFRIRSTVDLLVRNYLDHHGFLNLETPMLTKATPEGARDYLVPSRVYRGRMFALPQSPQLFKQLLMVSGFERYFQITKCFRDEDLRADRQPEFTQIDIEMSFSNPVELFEIMEGMIREIFAVKGATLPTGFKQMSYDRVMEKYGTDRPDLRIPFEIQDFSADGSLFKSNILDAILANGGSIKGLVLPDSAKFSRKILDNINGYIREIGGKGAIWLKKTTEGFKSSIKTEAAVLEQFYQKHGIESDHIVFLIGEEAKQALFLAGKLREHLGRDSIEKDKLEFLWVVDFPLFFYNDEEKRLDSNHHPFTAPHHDDISKLDSEPLAVKSIAYDLVLNGVEIGGGSQRINNLELQEKVFRLLGLSEEEIKEKFGFFLDALKFGAPPHMGIAFGLDRIIMLLTGEESIREVITFPKTTSSLCLLTGSPSTVPQQQLTELGLKIVENKKE